MTIAATEPVAAGSDKQTPLEALRALTAEGTLAAQYHRVAGLLAEIAGGERGETDLARAGNVLARLDREAVLAAAPATETATVAITGHSTLGSLPAPLVAEFARHGILLDARLGDFDAYVRDLQDTGSACYAADVQLALCVLDPQVVFDELGHPWSVAGLTELTQAKLTQLDRLVEHFVEHGTATLVFNTVPLLRAHTHQLVDLASRAELGIAWREFNAGLLRLALKHPRVQVIDLDPLVAVGGAVSEPRMATYAKANLGDELLGRYAREVAHLARTLRGRAKKVLVVDADNTMWDGILGDDGPEGIAAATTFRGEAFGNFQRVVKQIGAQGVLLAVSSKNDQEPVLQVLREHPDMVLREADFVRVNANWNPKDANLNDIASKLNLGVDSFVFADDSPFECGLVAASLPGVAVVRLDDEPALHIEKLLADGWFDVLELTAEDRARASSYRTDSARAELLENTGSMEEYLRQLGVVMTLAEVTEQEIGRVAQLSLRTNQFNLTTQRLQPEEVGARVADPDHVVLYLKTGDRFGDNGVVGALFARKTGDGLHVDNMLLSCRVFARGIEQAAVASVLAYAAREGLGPVHASYRPTKKNKNVRDFWPSLGFATTHTSDEELRFTHDLAELPAIPAHLTLDSALEGPQT